MRDSRKAAAEGDDLPAPARALAEEIVNMYSTRTQLEVFRLGAELRERIESVREEVAREVRAARTELKGEMGEIKGELKEQRAEMSAYGKDIVEIKVRSNEGEKRFRALEERMDGVEARGQEAAVGLAKLAGAAGAGGAIAAAVVRFFF